MLLNLCEPRGRRGGTAPAWRVYPRCALKHDFWGSRDGLCLLSGPRGSHVLGSREKGAKGKAESNLKDSSGIHSPACAARLMRRLSGSLQHCCCTVAFANTAFESKGERKKSTDTFFKN